MKHLIFYISIAIYKHPLFNFYTFLVSSNKKITIPVYLQSTRVDKFGLPANKNK